MGINTVLDGFVYVLPLVLSRTHDFFGSLSAAQIVKNGFRLASVYTQNSDPHNYIQAQVYCSSIVTNKFDLGYWILVNIVRFCIMGKF